MSDLYTIFKELLREAYKTNKIITIRFQKISSKSFNNSIELILSVSISTMMVP